MTEQCNMCGRSVTSFFDHVDVDCLNWPSPDAKLPLIYRGYHVGSSIYYGYDFIHDDYDEGDPRHGNENTLDGCYRAIDELEDD